MHLPDSSESEQISGKLNKSKEKQTKVSTKLEAEEAMEVTAREGPPREEEGVRVLEQTPCRTCQIPTFSNAGASTCLPVES